MRPTQAAGTSSLGPSPARRIVSTAPIISATRPIAAAIPIGAQNSPMINPAAPATSRTPIAW